MTKTIPGRPAVLHSDRTIAISLGGDGRAESGPGGIARTLLVAQGREDDGRSFEVTVGRQDDVRPDDAALLRVAQRVLPTIPSWTAG